MLRRVLRTVAEFGVANLHLINTARVEKSYWQSPLLAPAKLEDALLAGMERASDTVMPLVHQHKLFRPFVEDQLSVLCAGRPCWIAQMGSAESLRDTPPGQAVVMVGPEEVSCHSNWTWRSGSWRDRCTLAHAPSALIRLSLRSWRRDDGSSWRWALMGDGTDLAGLAALVADVGSGNVIDAELLDGGPVEAHELDEMDADQAAEVAAHCFSVLFDHQVQQREGVRRISMLVCGAEPWMASVL